MQHLKAIFFTTLIGACISCVDHHAELTQEQELQRLKEQWSKIESIAMNASCTDSLGWAFTFYGTRCCGGPVGYIIYSTTIDTTAFLKEIESYNRAQKEYIIKWPCFGPCFVPPTPTGVECANGVPVFTY
ncbi:MAG TPA: hypothetical protein PLX35_09245 [Cyclobacteriaceae bacterium]|nr:hypothetical protein [Cyclobacteriaceae bacterium]